MDHQMSKEGENNSIPVTAEYLNIAPNVPFRIKVEEEDGAYFMDHQETSEDTDHPKHNPFIIKEEEAHSSVKQGSSRLRPNSQPREMASHMKEEPAYCMDQGDSESHQNISVRTRHAGMVQIVPVCVKEEMVDPPVSFKQEEGFVHDEHTDPVDNPSSLGTNHISNSTEEDICSHIVKEEEVPYSIKYTDSDEDSEDLEDDSDGSGTDYTSGSTNSVDFVFDTMMGLQPYMFEPEYTEEELAAQESLRVPTATSDSSPASEELNIDNDPARLLNLESWCLCKVCVLMPSLAECFCCREFLPCMNHLTDDHNCKCITEHPDFKPVCLTSSVLLVVCHLMHELRGNVATPTTNRQFRLLAYRTFRWWTLGKVGCKVQKVIPACVVRRIREQFPSDGDDYAGPKSAEEIEDAWKI